MNPANRQRVEQLRQATGYRLGLKEWETIVALIVKEDRVMVMIETYEVKVLVREDRYLRKGDRVLVFVKGKLDSDATIWDDDFVPYVYEKVGRRRTAEETIEQREWEKLCHRPGGGRFPLDSYDRVLDPFIKSTDKMERHY